MILHGTEICNSGPYEIRLRLTNLNVELSLWPLVFVPKKGMPLGVKRKPKFNVERECMLGKERKLTFLGRRKDYL